MKKRSLIKSKRRQSYSNPESLEKKHELHTPIIAEWMDFSLAVISLFCSIIALVVSQKNWYTIALSILSTVLISMKAYIIHKRHITKKDYECLQQIRRLSVATLNAFRESNSCKSRFIAQSTYGQVTKWHPINYKNNVLVYDVHEQLRSILIEIKNMIIELTPELTEDQVSVDLLCCYPSKKYNGRIPINAGNTDDTERLSKHWRFITSGDKSHMEYVTQDFLKTSRSFYSKLDEESFLFYNSKKECTNYIETGKDREYKDSDGSVVGLVIEFKNDYPEAVLVKGLLTISTYGRKLYEDGDLTTEEDYINIFKQIVLNNYKSLIVSEFSQMYIRHMIRDGRISYKTGKVKERFFKNKKYK